MSTPRTADLPGSVRAVPLPTPRATFAALRHDAAGEPRGTVLLVPGFTGAKEDFAPLLPLLAARGHDVVAYDQRGQHETPGSDDADYSLPGLAADLLAVADAVRDGPLHLVGHSFGGLVATRAVVDRPSAWSSVTLLCSGPGAFAADAATRPLAAAARIIRESGTTAFLAAKQALAARGGAPAPSPDVQAALERRYALSSATAMAAVADHLREAPDLVDALAATGVPAHVVRGADDDAWPHASQDDAAARLGTTVVVVPDAAHSPAVENPQACADALDRLLG